LVDKIKSVELRNKKEKEKGIDKRRKESEKKKSDKIGLKQAVWMFGSLSVLVIMILIGR